MSIIYCEKHNRRWDSDRVEECPICIDQPEHSTEDDYQHFLSYSKLEHSGLLRYAYFHGANADAEQPSGPSEHGPAKLTIQALERMISSVIDDLAKTDAALLETTADLNGELRGLSAARAYLLAAIEKSGPVSEAGKDSGK